MTTGENRVISAFQLKPHQPSLWLPGGHSQTVLGRMVRHKFGVIFNRRRLITPDDDFIDLDFPEVAGFPLPAEAPLVLLLHGLEGNARRSYAYETYRLLARLGVRSVGMNFRSCSGEINRQPRFYHSGMTDDVAFVLNALAEWFPDSRRGLFGFSLGANLTLKYLGELGQAGKKWVQAAAAVSPPFDMKASSDLLTQGISLLYTHYFLQSLRHKVRAKAALLEPLVDIEKVIAARTFREFDNVLTAPLHGFRDADDYYARCSTAQFLPHIQVPTLLVRALDDPLFNPNDVPYETLQANRFLLAGITKRGGHMGFVEGYPGKFNCWAEREAARFLAFHLLKD